MAIRFDTSEVADLADVLVKAAGVAPVEARKVVAKGSLNVRQDARRRSSGIAHAPTYPYTITYDTEIKGTTIIGEIGPDKDKEVGGGKYRTPGNLGAILEYGTSRDAPIPHMGPAGEAERPKFEKAMEALSVKPLERGFS